MIPKLNQYYSIISSSIFLALPIVALAQESSRFIGNINRFITLLLALLLSVAAIIFIWGVVKFIASGDDAAARGKATGFILFGIIGIVVILSFWGLSGIILDYFGLEEGRTPLLPPEVRPLPGGGLGSSGGGG